MLQVGMYEYNWYFRIKNTDYRITSIKGKWRLLKAAKKIGDWDFVNSIEYQDPWQCFRANFSLGKDHEYIGR